MEATRCNSKTRMDGQVLRFTALIKDGKINWHDIADLERFLFDLEGEAYIDIKPSKIRNTAQNNFYWKLLSNWGMCIGYSKEEMHEVVKSHFKISSTSDMNKDEFSEFLDEAIRYALENGYNGDDPRITKPL